MEIDDEFLERIVVQLNALLLIVRRSSGWEFSAKGLEYASRLLAIKKGQRFGESSTSFRIAAEIFESRPEPEVKWDL